MGDWLRDLWFAIWHWVYQHGSTLGTGFSLALGAALSTGGGYVARQREDIRERRARILLDVLPPLAVAAERWLHLEKADRSAAVDTLRRNCVAASAADAQRATRLSSAAENVDRCEQAMLSSLDPGGGRRSWARRSMRELHRDFSYSPALLISHGFSAEQNDLVSQLVQATAAVSNAVLEYQSWLERKLARRF